MVRTISGMIVGALVASLALMGCWYASATLYPLPTRADFATPESLSAYAAATPSTAIACILGGWALAGLLGGWTSAKIAWPHRGGAQTGLLIDRLSRGELHPQGLRIWLEAGIREPIIFRANQALLAHLEQQTIFWRQVDGGHDALCWRGGLTAGLIQLWQPLCRDE